MHSQELAIQRKLVYMRMSWRLWFWTLIAGDMNWCIWLESKKYPDTQDYYKHFGNKPGIVDY